MLETEIIYKLLRSFSVEVVVRLFKKFEIRDPIEFPNKSFFTGKLLLLCYLINSNVLF
jgi:hypothetical protein